MRQDTGAILTFRTLRVPLLASLFALLCLAIGASTASATITYESSFGGGGGSAGKFSRPAGVAVNNSTGDVYVADYGNNRVEQFTEGGEFIRAWGYDVVASGEDNKSKVNEVDEVKIRASGGSFRLIFEEGEGFEKQEEATDLLPFDATPTEVEEALNGLEMINSEGGGVSVTGGPGNPTGSTPYVVEFNEGPMKERDVTLGIDPSALALPPGTELTCAAGGVFSYGSTFFSYQWLANGEPIAGATSNTFTPGSGEAGEAVQCRAAVHYASEIKTLGVSEPYFIGPGSSTVAPPLAPELYNSANQLQAPSSSPVKLPVGESSGAELTCNAGTWTRNPESYTYRWYRNGVQIASETSTETTNTYTLTDEDTAEKAHFQCSVTASNAGGASIAFSGLKDSEPAPEGYYLPRTTVVSPESHTSRIITKTNGGAVFEVCEANPPSNDVCKAGVAGPSFGQFDAPRSIAVDNSLGGNGDVYVHDEGNFRVQKFSADGQPLFEIGKGVDETTEATVCTEASGDACGPGLRAIDESPNAIGYSGPVWYSDYAKQHVDLGNQLAVDPAGHVYLAEIRQSESEARDHNAGCPEELCGPRIQKWDSSGNFISMARLPDRNAPVSIGVDSNETAYVTVANGNLNGVERVYGEEFGPTGGSVHVIGNFFHPTGEPRQAAIDPRNDRLLVSDLNEKETLFATEQLSVCGGPLQPGRAVIEFDVHMNEIDCSVPLAGANLPEVTGMSVSGGGVLYTAVGNENVIKVFHLPVPAPPVIGEESAKKITTQSGELHAQINPGFEETSYRVEYGLGDCEVTACTTAYGGESLGGLKPTDAVVKIAGLEPEKVYHYRFIAENALGEDVGEDMTFSTYSLVDITHDSCPNALARQQTRSAGLLDCRAYELVSAGWTGGYDVVSNLVPGQHPFDGYPDAFDKVLYGVKDGGIPGTGYPTNRGIDPYVAERDESGWHTRYVGIPSNNPYASGPFSSTLLGATPDLTTFAFGGPQICNPCFADGSSGMPLRLPNGELVQGMAGSQSHPNAEEAGYVAKPLSADGKHLVFGSSSDFASPATEGEATLYERELGGSGPATEVISTRSDGSTMTGEVGELDISSDGTRVIVGEKVGEDGEGNPLWHLYLHIRGSADSIDLAEGTSAGAHFAGMSSDGSVIYFSTVDSLLAEDEDESVDIYRAEVDGSGNLTLNLVSVNSDGSVSNYEGCEPPGVPRQWNAIEGEGHCNAVAFAGGAGVSAGDGTLYFVSPEQLEAGEGIENQANLYVVKAGEAPKPRFVALMDSSLEKSGQPPAEHPLVTEKFAGAELSFPGEMTFDSARNDLYAVSVFGGSVSRYHADGTPDNFTAGGGAGTNQVEGFSFELGSWNQIAVDNSPASEGTPLEDALYVPDYGGVHVVAPSGETLGVINGSGTTNGSFGRACGVAVDQATGAVYISDFGGYIWRYTPNSPSGTIEDSDYTVEGIKTGSVKPCSIAVDTIGNVYAVDSKPFYQGVGFAYRWSASSFAASPPEVTGTEVGASAGALATDPKTNELYLDTGKFIKVFNSSGAETANYGNGKLVCSPEYPYNSRGVAIDPNSKHSFASCLDSLSEGGPVSYPGTIREWGFMQPPYAPINNPAIVHGVLQPEVHTWGDFQITNDSKYAAFATVVPLKEGYDNGGHYEVYRYQQGNGELLCVSCDPTGSKASTDAELPPSGLGLLSDGRLFFNTGESLTLADANEKLDAYEYSPQRAEAPGGCKADGGCQQLISTGTSAHPEGMLGVSSNGKDAFFFTREALVPEDKNGQAMKIYDAREEGGFFVIPPPPPCAASDECHGPSTQAQAPPQIGTFKGSGGQFKPRHCKKGYKLRHGRCVKVHKHHKPRRHHKHKRARRHSHNARQGGSR